MMTFMNPFDSAAEPGAACLREENGKLVPVSDLGYSPELQDMLAWLLTKAEEDRPSID